MKLYVKASRSYGELKSICDPIRSEILSGLNKVCPELKWWDNGYKDLGGGTIRISFGIGGFNGREMPSIKEGRQLMLQALCNCSKELQEQVVKVTGGQNGDRGRIWTVISVVVEPSTNDYYGIHDL